MNTFYKFPTTPHLCFLSDRHTRDDKLLSEKEVSDFLSNEIIIEEKIDGANLGIHFSSNGTLYAQNRGHFLIEPFEGQWRPLKNWIDVHIDDLFDVLEDKRILFGEWCYAKHSIFYDKLPDWFVAFDIFDIEEKRYFSVKRRNQLLEGKSFATVPFIGEGKFELKELKELHFKSVFGKGECEGIYLRLDDGDWLRMRAKIVHSSFTQTIGEHWSKMQLTPNHLYYQTSPVIAEDIRTMR